jgi:hypothetical protein
VHRGVCVQSIDITVIKHAGCVGRAMVQTHVTLVIQVQVEDERDYWHVGGRGQTFILPRFQRGAGNFR